MTLVNRNQILRELEPGLNKIFDTASKGYENEHLAIFSVENSDRAFEEELLFTGFGAAPVKREGAGVQYDSATEGWLARYSHETIALAFAITEEAVEDNLYDKLSTRLTRALARSMAHTKQVKAANVINNGFSSSFLGGDGKALMATDHPLRDGGSLANKPTTDADLSETSMEDATIAVEGFVDDRGIPQAIMVRSLLIPRQLAYVAERLFKSTGRVGTTDNDINALVSRNVLPEGFSINHRFTDPDAWVLKTDAPDGLKMFVRAPIKTGMEGDFETGNARYKARERYSFGWSNWRGVYGSTGA
jgi:hypothetical protein